MTLKQLVRFFKTFFATSFPSSIFETLLTPYYVSVWNGNLSHVLFLWSFIKDKNPHIGRYEDTLLHAVAERGHSSIFKLILNEVLNKNPKGHFADTPLHFAAEKGHTEIVSDILARVSDKNPPNIYEETPLHRAAKKWT